MAGSGDDVGVLSQGPDTFLAGSGSDLITPGPGADEIEGTAGDDDVARSSYPKAKNVDLLLFSNTRSTFFG